MEHLLTAAEAAELLRVKIGTIYQWAYQRRLTKVKLFGDRGPVRFRMSDLQRLIARGVIPALRTAAEVGF